MIVAPNVCQSYSTKRLLVVVNHDIWSTRYQPGLELEIMYQFMHNGLPETDNCYYLKEYENQPEILVI